LTESKFKAVLFDLGGTLVKTEDPPEGHRRILEFYGVKVSCGDATKAHSENEREFDVREMAEMGSAFWVKWNMKLLERLGIDENKEFLAKKIDEMWWNYAHLEVYPDVVDTLVHLRAKGMRLGIVTNGLQKDYQQILGKLALADYFDVVVGVDACAKAKPDKEVFLYAVNKLGVNLKETLFVGDSVKYDFEGAKKAGLKPLLINRTKETPANVDTIESLTAVLQYV